MFLKKTSYTLLMTSQAFDEKRESIARPKSFKKGKILENFTSVFIKDVFPLHQKRDFVENKSSFWKNGKILQGQKVSNRAKYSFLLKTSFHCTKSVILLKINQAFEFFLKKTSYMLLMKLGKILQGQKVSNRVKCWKIVALFETFCTTSF